MKPEELVRRLKEIPQKAEVYPTDYGRVEQEYLEELYQSIGFYAISYLETFESIAEEIERRENRSI
jgi:hypothetical protein